MLGYPENGPYSLSPARVGETRDTVSEDSYGRGPIDRTITALAGDVRSGNSGGPLVDARGRVIGTVDGARIYSVAHPGAIYLHQGRQWRVAVLDVDAREARLVDARPRRRRPAKRC